MNQQRRKWTKHQTQMIKNYAMDAVKQYSDMKDKTDNMQLIAAIIEDIMLAARKL